MKERLIVRNLKKAYGERLILQQVNLQLMPGKTAVILGKSGSGKSTFLNCIATLLPYDQGEILRQEGIQLGYMFQKPELFSWLTVEENITFPIRTHRQRTTQIMVLLELTQLTPFAHLYPKELSMGMQQRVSLARALIQSHDLLLLDEPFSSLDWFIKQALYQNLLDIQKTFGTAIILVTHDLEEAICLGDEVYILNDQTHTIHHAMSVSIEKDARLDFMEDARVIEMRRKLRKAFV